MAEQFELDREKHIVIDGKVYDRSTLTEEHIRLVSLINYADQQIVSKTTDLDLYKAGRDEQVKRLIETIGELKPVAEVQPEAAE